MKPRFTPCFSLKVSLYFFADIHNGAHIHFIESGEHGRCILSFHESAADRLPPGCSSFPACLPGNNAAPGFRPGLLMASKTSCLKILPLDPEGTICAASTFLGYDRGGYRREPLRQKQVRTSAFPVGQGLPLFLFLLNRYVGFFRLSRIRINTAHHISNGQRIAFFGNLPELAPAFSALISNVAFSLSSSAITSSLFTHSPSCFNHRTRVTSLILSPTVGTLISITIDTILFGGKFRVKCPDSKQILDTGEFECLKRVHDA